MNQLKNSIEKHVLNDEDMLIRIRKVNQQMERKNNMRKNVWISIGVAAAMIIAVVSTWSALLPAPISTKTATTKTQALSMAGTATTQIQASSALGTTTNKIQVTSAQPSSPARVYALVSVDINPSFEFYIDKTGRVIEIKAKNADAETLAIKSLIGLPVEEAVAKSIRLATDAGFIKSGDATDDYVIVSTIILDENDTEGSKNQDSIGYKIQQAVAAAGLNATTKVAIIKATLQEKHSADKNGVPLGLYIINGMIEKDGDMISVSEFSKNKNNLDKLAKRAAIVSAKEARKAIQESKKQANGTNEVANSNMLPPNPMTGDKPTIITGSLN